MMSLLGHNGCKTKNIVLTIPLLYKLLECAKTNPSMDVAMIMERIVSFSDGVSALTTEVFDCIVSPVDCQSLTQDGCCVDTSMVQKYGEDFEIEMPSFEEPSCCGYDISQYESQPLEICVSTDGDIETVSDCGIENCEEHSETEDMIQQIIRLGKL